MSAPRVEVCRYIRLEHAAAFEAEGWDVAPCGGHHFVNHGALLAVRTPPSIAAIRRVVCDQFGVSERALVGRCAARSVARPRQVAMWLAHRMTGKTATVIGRHLGGRHHTTVLHGVRKIDDLRTVDADLAASLEALRQFLTREGR